MPSAISTTRYSGASRSCSAEPPRGLGEPVEPARFAGECLSARSNERPPGWIVDRLEMARIGIIADIHANEEALSAVLADMGRVDRLFCLGDVVGYGASPDSCIEMVREAGADTILGNHELGLLGTLEPSWFNEFARAAIE